MSKGKPTPDTVIKLVHAVWLTNQGKSGAQVHREFERIHGKRQISKRKVQQLIPSVFEKTSEGKPIEKFPITDWEGPWKEKQINPAATAFLLRLAFAKSASRREDLFEIEAKWGKRLRVCLEALNVHDQLQIVRLYAAREVSGYHFDTEPRTEDLDAMCAYMPWYQENLSAYESAIDSGLVHSPNLDGVDFSGIWASSFTRVSYNNEKLIRQPRLTSVPYDKSEARGMVNEVQRFWKSPWNLQSKTINDVLYPNTDGEEE